MIEHLTHVYSDLDGLRAELSSEAFTRLAESSTALLVQIYSAETDRAHMRPIVSLIAERLPRATVVGASTVGEIAHGRLLTHQTVIGFTFFASSELAVVAMACHGGDERAVGAELGRRIRQWRADAAGVLLLATPLSIDAAALLEGMESAAIGCPVFGGARATTLPWPIRRCSPGRPFSTEARWLWCSRAASCRSNRGPTWAGGR